jgi:hypothetical protein
VPARRDVVGALRGSPARSWRRGFLGGRHDLDRWLDLDIEALFAPGLGAGPLLLEVTLEQRLLATLDTFGPRVAWLRLTSVSRAHA